MALTRSPIVPVEKQTISCNDSFDLDSELNCSFPNQLFFTPSPPNVLTFPWANQSIVESVVNDTLPAHLRFTQTSLTVVIVYCVLFVVAAVGNLTVFITLFKSRHRKSRISLMITHLAVADLMVTFIMIPLEVGWRLTVQWMAGNMACKIFLFLRAFGLYLSSNVLVCVSLDRYFAILHPLRVNDARRRGKVMLACAWVVSLLWSVPQSIVFHVSPHPKYPAFHQCVSFGFFSSPTQEMAYNLFCVIAMYFVPLIVIIVSYTCIMCEISHKSRETNGDSYPTANGRMRLRRSDMTNIERARSRTLKMTVTIVLVFVWCWTPYVVMTLWYMFDRDSAAKVATWLQDALFMMAVSNSCMNPLVYGSYAMNFRKECCRCISCLCPPQSPARLARNGTDFDAVAGQGGIKRRVIKCVYTLRKVYISGGSPNGILGSGATRSTAMLHGVIRSPAGTPQPAHLPIVNHITKSPVKPICRLPSIGHISVLSEPLGNGCGYRPSFHSDPIGHAAFLQPEGASLSDIEHCDRDMDAGHSGHGL